MAASFLFDNCARRSRVSLAAIAIMLIAPLAATAAETVTVQLDKARIAHLPHNVSTVVVGNPLIADVSLQSGGLMVLTGKGYGATNLLALDREGNVLSELLVQVEGTTDGVVIVYRGDAREFYFCTPNCEPRIALGDTAAYFDTVIAQAGVRTSRAQGAGSTGAAPGGNMAAR